MLIQYSQYAHVGLSSDHATDKWSREVSTVSSFKLRVVLFTVKTNCTETLEGQQQMSTSLTRKISEQES